jgi:type II secretory pathway pseudopilin PulG
MKPGSGERGYALVALVAALTIMLIAMSVGAPTWRYVVQNDREEELIFRGSQISDAVGRYQRKNGSAFPPNLDVLVKGKFLRRAYKDPMTKDGEWRLLRPGEQILPALPRPGVPGLASPSPSPTPSPTPTPRFGPGGPGGELSLGGIVGVVSRSTETSIRLFNGRSRYDQWIFAPGQPRVIGRLVTPPNLLAKPSVSPPANPNPSPGTGGPLGSPAPPAP